MSRKNHDKTVDNLESVLNRANNTIDFVIDDFKSVFGFTDEHPNYSDVCAILSAGFILRHISSKLGSMYAESELSAEYKVKSEALMSIAAKLAGKPDNMTDDDYFEELVKSGRRTYSRTGRYSQEYAVARICNRLEEMSRMLSSIDSKLNYTNEEG